MSVGDLPSSDDAKAFLKKPSPGGAALLARDWFVRGLIIAAGVEIFTRKRASLRGALAGSAAIELFVLGYTALNVEGLP